MNFLVTVAIVCVWRGVAGEAHSATTRKQEPKCLDWQNKTVSTGEEFYPKANDPCHMCVCDAGLQTMCRDVSCQPPSCPNWKQVPGKCCRFECVDGNNTIDSDGNTTHSSTMTDLGLRLVASTVTTFLILALLLFLIHRFRQRRLLMTLRRYSRRREVLEDSDYSPEFFGIQCPPYEDPPPPYTPPKPAPGEAPPPYDAINSNGDINSNTNGHQNADFVDGVGNDRNIHDGHLRHPRSGMGNVISALNARNNAAEFQNNARVHGLNSSNSESRNRNPADRVTFDLITGSPTRSSCASSATSSTVDSPTVEFCRLQNTSSGHERNTPAVHFRNNSSNHPCITMGVQNRNRNHRNRFSDASLSTHTSPLRQNIDTRGLAITDNARALNLELRNTVHNLRNGNLNLNHANTSRVLNANQGELSSSTTDIGESTTSAESLMSSPESPNYETDHTMPTPSNSQTNPNEADITVQRFFDRHFGGPVANSRRYPTTMSQSWTSAQNSTSGPNVKQSISLTAFPPVTDITQPLNQADRLRSQQHLPRSKSEHLKTNGSLINQPFNGVFKGPKHNPLPNFGRGARVAYKDADELKEQTSVKSTEPKIPLKGNDCPAADIEESCLDRTMDTDTCDNASICTNVSSLAAAILDPGEIIVTKRQDELRNLRLSHLLSQPLYSNEPHVMMEPVSCSSPKPLTRSLSDHSMDVGNVYVNAESAAKHSQLEGTISNDSKYPAATYKNLLQSCLSSGPRPTGENSVKSSTGQLKSQKDSRKKVEKQNSASSDTGMSAASSQDAGSTHSTPSKGPIRGLISRGRGIENGMVHSWHAGVVDPREDNVLMSKMNTLVRNSNGNFEKKTCGSKDVTNVFFPHYKVLNVEIEDDIDRQCVPSSEMRACASQLYNQETEESDRRRDKRKSSLFKRHSTGCFPTKHDHPACRSPAKMKSNQERSVLSHTDRDKRHSSHRDQKCARHTSLANAREYENYPKIRENGPQNTDLTPPYLMHSAIPKDFALLDRGLSGLMNEKPKQSHAKTDKRSRSLGRGDSRSNSKRAQRDNSSGRKKKSQLRQSGSFQTELEHVLDRQKSALKTSPTKHCRHSLNGVDRSNCAITQV